MEAKSQDGGSPCFYRRPEEAAKHEIDETDDDAMIGWKVAWSRFKQI
jgi:hypothetical protein